MVGRRAFRVAVLAGALSTMVQMLPEQPLREQLIELIEQVEIEADALVGQFEVSDELLVGGLKSA